MTGQYAYKEASGPFGFAAGDVMEVLEEVDQNWIRVKKADGAEGLAPVNYVANH